LTSLTFYGGVNEIGGNKILLEDKDTRVFLDFGKGFTRRAKFFEEYINPRVANGIEDFLTIERESKDSILRQFNIAQINDFFPEYEKEIKKALNFH
jgi:mRNA degradation ribonuclease J1/J2